MWCTVELAVPAISCRLTRLIEQQQRSDSGRSARAGLLTLSGMNQSLGQAADASRMTAVRGAAGVELP
jgi:hypothetical protein